MSKPKTDLRLVAQTEKVAEAEVIGQSIATHGVVRESPVDVLYMIEAPKSIFDTRSDMERRFIRVKLYLKANPTHLSFTDIRCHGKSRKEMARACEFAAAALAERHHIMHGAEKSYDPFVAAKAARKTYEELVEYMLRQAVN